jgi:GT2 family glycosyltransferase
MIERAKFELVGGFDERFTVGGGDVALGLSLHERGYWNVMTPYARLIHHESQSRGTVVPESDLAMSLHRYAPYLDGRDPFYNPNLTLDDTTCRVRPRPDVDPIQGHGDADALEGGPAGSSPMR